MSSDSFVLVGGASVSESAYFRGASFAVRPFVSGDPLPGTVCRVPRTSLGRNERCHCALNPQRLLHRATRFDEPTVPTTPLTTPLCACELHELLECLPNQQRGYTWNCIFDSCCDGFSLAHMYRRLEGAEGPGLCIIEAQPRKSRRTATSGSIPGAPEVFGVYASDMPTLSHGSRYFGSGETFVYRIERCPPASSTVACWRWTYGRNEHYMMATPTVFSVGAGSHGAALYFNRDLLSGTTCNGCGTFHSPALCGLPNSGLTQAEFTVSRIQWFAFGSQFEHLSRVPTTVAQLVHSTESDPAESLKDSTKIRINFVLYETQCGWGTVQHHQCVFFKEFRSSLLNLIGDDNISAH